MAMEGQDQGGGFIIPGMRFDPEEDDLLRFYLIPKINGDPLPWDGIKEFDVYGKQGPWEIIHGSETSEVYVFAISKNKSRSMKQRTCDFGTWKQQKSSPVEHQGQTIGYGSYLSFYPEKGLNPGFLGGSWNMTEYCLKGHEQNEGYVVCKVSFKVWSAKERARRGLDEMPAAVSDASDIDTVPSRKRTKVACGINNDGAGSDIDAARPRKKAKVAVCGGSSNNPEATTSACAPSYSSCAAAVATNLDHCSSSTVEEQQPPAYGFSSTPNLERNNVVEWEAPAAASYYEDNGYLNLGSNDYNDNVVDDQYLCSGNVQQEVAAGFVDPSLYYEDHSHLLDSNNDVDQNLYSNYDGVEQPETSPVAEYPPVFYRSSSNNEGAEQLEASSAAEYSPVFCSSNDDGAEQLEETSSVAVEYPGFCSSNDAINFGHVMGSFLTNLEDDGLSWYDEWDDGVLVPQHCIIGDDLWTH